MATFSAQVTALTTITISSSSTYPTEAQLTQFLTDGTREIINILPPDLLQYCVDYSELTNDTAMNIGTDTDIGKIVFVTHYDGERYLPARKIPAAFSSLANDSTSLKYFGTDSDPVYWIISNGSNPGLEVFPSPTSTKRARVHHIAYPATAFNWQGIDNFPDSAEYLVVLYASMKSLLSAIGALAIPPDAFGDGTALTSDATALSTEQVGVDAEFLQFDQWFTALGEMIEDDEDIELASAQIEKINAYVNTWNVQLQGNLAEMQQYTALFQALKGDYTMGIQMLTSGGLPQAQPQQARR
jgi:hypothetical protein